MPNVKFDTYCRYENLTRIIKGLAEETPRIVRLESLTQCHEGHELWVVSADHFGGE